MIQLCNGVHYSNELSHAIEPVGVSNIDQKMRRKSARSVY